jgi:hypothetical protein
LHYRKCRQKDRLLNVKDCKKLFSVIRSAEN